MHRSKQPRRIVMPTQADDRMLRVMLRYDGPDSFQQFVADMGRRPEGKTLDRRDASGPYSPQNCRWGGCERAGEQSSSAHLVPIVG